MKNALRLLNEIMHGGSEEEIAGQATGIRQHPAGIGQFYLSGGHAVEADTAYAALRHGSSVEVPNAGAGSYRAVLSAMGFTDVESWDTTSSAGDWSFIVHDGEGGFWYPGFQQNLYPRHGFIYNIDPSWGFETKEELIEWMQSQ